MKMKFEFYIDELDYIQDGLKLLKAELDPAGLELASDLSEDDIFLRQRDYNRVCSITEQIEKPLAWDKKNGL